MVFSSLVRRWHPSRERTSDRSSQSSTEPLTPRQEAYRLYLQSGRWQAIRLWRLWWDGGCRVCNAPVADSEVHHRRYRFKGRLGWAFGIGYLLEWFDCITLCDKHHDAIHKVSKISEFE